MTLHSQLDSSIYDLKKDIKKKAYSPGNSPRTTADQQQQQLVHYPRKHNTNPEGIKRSPVIQINDFLNFLTRILN